MRVAALLLTGSVGLVQGCASLPKSCAAIVSASAGASYASGVVAVARASRPLAEESLARLQCRADLRQMDAILELGRRYDEGVGVVADPSRAAALYRRAATPVPPTTAIYSPPVRRGGNGRMLFLDNPNASPGSSEAQFRLGRLYLEGRGVPRNVEEGRQLIQAAAAQGYEDALAFDRRAGQSND